MPSEVFRNADKHHSALAGDSADKWLAVGLA
jgi:hypothetical protein